VLAPQCMRHLPLGIAGARHGVPCRGLAPHLGAVFGSPGGFPLFSQPFRGKFVWLIPCPFSHPRFQKRRYGQDGSRGQRSPDRRHLIFTFPTTICWPTFPRWRFRASICAVKVRTSRTARCNVGIQPFRRLAFQRRAAQALLTRLHASHPPTLPKLNKKSGLCSC